MKKEYVESDLIMGKGLLCTHSELMYWTVGKIYPLNDEIRGTLSIMDDDDDVFWNADEIINFLNHPNSDRSFELVELESRNEKYKFERSDIIDGMILVCTKSNYPHWTVGKEYEVNDGEMVDDDGDHRDIQQIVDYLNKENVNLFNLKFELESVSYKFEPIDIDAPNYYTGGIETKDYIRSHDLNFNRGSAVKYATRAGKKDKDKEIEDLKKAINFLQFEIDYLENEN